MTPNRSDTGARPFSRRINTAWTSFFARERALTSCWRRARRRRIRDTHSGGTHTASSSPVHSSFASVRASSRSVFARAWLMPVSPGDTTITLLTCGSSSLTISHELPVTSSATRSVGRRLSASVLIPSGVEGTRPAEYSLPSSQIAISMKSRCTSSPMHLPSGRDSNRLVTAHLLYPVVPRLMKRRTSGRTTQTDSRSQRTRASRRGRHRVSTDSKSIVQTGVPDCVLHNKNPLCPVNR